MDDVSISHYSSTPVGGTLWHSCLRHCATSQEFAGSILNGVIGIFINIILLVALWSWGTKAIVPGNFTWGVKAAGA